MFISETCVTEISYVSWEFVVLKLPSDFFLLRTRRWLMAMGSKLYIALPSLIWRWWNRPAVIGTSWDGEKMEGTVMECHNIPTGAGFMLINEIMGPWAFVGYCVIYECYGLTKVLIEIWTCLDVIKSIQIL